MGKYTLKIYNKKNMQKEIILCKAFNTDLTIILIAIVQKKNHQNKQIAQF